MKIRKVTKLVYHTGQRFRRSVWYPKIYFSIVDGEYVCHDERVEGDLGWEDRVEDGMERLDPDDILGHDWEVVQ